MDVTPGPRLRRQITVAQERLDRFDADKIESAQNPDLPAPDWQGWALQFATILREFIGLVRP